MHPSILCDKRDKEEFSRVERAVDDLFSGAGAWWRCRANSIGTSKMAWWKPPREPLVHAAYALRFRSKKHLNASKIVSL
ncbi:MAG: hypothetical protein ACLR7Z_05470 [Bilophila wadsworthia]